jgi:hypothetical protein
MRNAMSLAKACREGGETNSSCFQKNHEQAAATSEMVLS